MKNMNDLNRLVELLVRHRFPKEQILFMEIGEYNQTMNFLKNLGSSGAQSYKLITAEPEIECVSISYAGYTFNIVSY